MATLSLDARSKKWIKEGRGSGTGKDYRPWLTVRDLPSAGVVRGSRRANPRTHAQKHLNYCLPTMIGRGQQNTPLADIDMCLQSCRRHTAFRLN